MIVSPINRETTTYISSAKRLVGFPAVNTFIGFAERAKIAFNLLDKPECGPLLFFTGILAYRTGKTELCQFAILVCNFRFPGLRGHFSFGHLFPF
jgi:hypothetical protein